MNWWQTLIVALSTYVVTKVIDFVVSIVSEKREFKKYRREKIYNEIEELKNEIGKLYELAANWKAFEEKQKSYLTNFENDHELLGKYNKYPTIVNTARDTIHWCKIVASCEMRHTDNLIENKKELGEKYSLFLQACEKYLNNLL